MPVSISNVAPYAVLGATAAPYAIPRGAASPYALPSVVAAFSGVPPVTTWTVDYTVGAFSRTAAAWYQTGSPTDGSAAFMAQASGGARVYENLGDGAGALLRVEGARTNLVLRNRDLGNAAWTAGLGTLTTNDVASPDGTTSADRDAGSSAQYGPYQMLAVTPGSSYTGSMWCRSHSGTGSVRFALGVGAATLVTIAASPSTTYMRVAGTGTPAASPIVFVSSDGRVPYGPGAPASFDACFDLFQLELGAFPSSAIVTAAASVTRDADVLTLTTDQLPALLFTAAGQFTQVSPEFASADLVSGDTYWLWATDASNGVRIKHDGTGVRVEAVAGGVVKAASGYLTFARNALLGAVRWDPVAAVVSVNGVVGATGTAWTWTPATVRIGGIPSGAGEAFCRLGTLQSA